jgi:hypothetical protein
MTNASVISEIIPPLSLSQKSELVMRDTAIRKASASIRSSKCVIAFHGWRLHKSNRWHDLGYASEESYREAAGITPHMWDLCLTVGKLLEPLTLEQLTEIGIEKGILLTHVNSDLWFDFPWLQDAKRMSERDFRDVVTLRNRSLDSPEATEALLANQSSEDVVTRAKIDYLRRKYGLDNSIDAIKMALRDADSSVAIELAKAARHANKLLTLSQQALRSRRKSALSPTDKNIDRLIRKAKDRLSDAITCAVNVQLGK